MFRQGVLIVMLMTGLSPVIMAEVTNNEIAEQFQQAENLATQGQLNQAIAAYEALIKKHPRLPEAYNNLAALYLKQNNAKQAKLILEQGLLAHKGYGALYESLTAINVAMAREAYSKALQIDLKPAEVAIETLALNDEQPRKTKNAMVIAKSEPPLVTIAGNQSVTPAVKTEAKPVVAVAVEKPAEKVKTQTGAQVVKAATKNIEVETVIQAWAAAWAAQAVDMYLSFYHPQYHPDNGLSRESWKNLRKVRIKKPGWIKVKLTDFEVERNDGKQAVVKFKQHYESNGYADLTSKRMVLLYTDNGWQIFQEQSL